jgi:hypothetical protein
VKTHRINFLFLVLLLVISCSHADGLVRESEVELKILSNADNKALQVYDVYSKKRILPNSEGIFAFTAPFIRVYSNTFLFIEYESHSTEDVRFLEIRRDNDLLIALNLYEFNQLPKDENGRYLLKIDK